MREFSELEKRIINRIIELDDSLSANVLGNILGGTFAEYSEYYIKVESPTKCSVQIEQSYFLRIMQGREPIDKIKIILQGTSRDIYLAVKLIEYLENQNLLFSSGNSNLRDIGTKIHDGQYTDSTPFDAEICELLFKYSSKNYIPSHSLRSLRDNEFLNDDEIRHRHLVNQYNRTLKISAIAIFVSLLGVCSTAFLTVKTKTELINQNSNINVAIDKNVLSELNSKLDKIRTSIDGNKQTFIELIPDQLIVSKTLIREFIDESNKLRILLENRANFAETTKDDKAQQVNKLDRN